jgi:nicotinamidase-related amidase
VTAPDLRGLITPVHTALVTQEIQKGVVGDPAVFPALAEVAQKGMLENCGRLARAARVAGAAVIHCVAMRRLDGAGSNTNARLFAAAIDSPVALTPESEAVQVVDEVALQPTDLVLSRYHGLGPMAGTDLDAVLRNLGVKTIVGVGVSVNVGITNFVMDAVNAGYEFVLPRDAVAGVPETYAEAIIDNTLSLLATVVTTDDVIREWETV